MVLVTLLLGLRVTLRVAARLWSTQVLSETIGDARLGDLMGTGWPVEHVFVTSDLSGHGSVFFVANCIQPQICSVRLGFIDGRETPLLEALRASTAFPPLLPAVNVRLRAEPPKTGPIRGENREWLSSLEPGAPTEVLLVDGGLTGNLGIQLDSELAPDNITLLDIIGSNTTAGTAPKGQRLPYQCEAHRTIAWVCRRCALQRIVVDSSGRKPRAAGLVTFLLNVPLLGLFIHAVLCLRVGYESSLTDDQHLAGNSLVGVVRSERILERLAFEAVPLSDPRDAHARMVAAGGFRQRSKHLSNPTFRRALDGRPLVDACIAACDEAAKVKTGLTGVNRRRAAHVVASGFLNAHVTAYGWEDFSAARAGIRQLSALLGPEAGLSEWWNSLRNREDAAR